MGLCVSTAPRTAEAQQEAQQPIVVTPEQVPEKSAETDRAPPSTNPTPANMLHRPSAPKPIPIVVSRSEDPQSKDFAGTPSSPCPSTPSTSYSVSPRASPSNVIVKPILRLSNDSRERFLTGRTKRFLSSGDSPIANPAPDWGIRRAYVVVPRTVSDHGTLLADPAVHRSVRFSFDDSSSSHPTA